MISLRRQSAPSPGLRYSLSEHAGKRLGERTALTELAFLEIMSNGRAVQMNLADGHFDGCVYELLFSLADKTFFIAVTKPLRASRGGIVVTILTAEQHEADRGRILPAHLLQAARNMMPNEEFDAYGQAARERLGSLAATAHTATEPKSHSSLPAFALIDDMSTSLLTRGALLRAARVLLDGSDFNRFCSRLSNGPAASRLRSNQVRILVHYWDAGHEHRCLRLANPKVPAQHLEKNGLAAVNRHPAFWPWLASKIEAAGLDLGVKVSKIEAHITLPGLCDEPIELDLEAPLVENPEPYPAGDFEDSTPEPTPC